MTLCWGRRGEPDHATTSSNRRVVSVHLPSDVNPTASSLSHHRPHMATILSVDAAHDDG